jgi:hypothetical protein
MLITDHSQLSEALAFYGMGELAAAVAEPEYVKVAAIVERVTQDGVLCRVLATEHTECTEIFSEKRLSDLCALSGKSCEFQRSLVTLYFYTLERAVVRIPKAFLPAFCLWKYELTGKLLEQLETRVATNNALPPPRPARTETIGNVRI